MAKNKKVQIPQVEVSEIQVQDVQVPMPTEKDFLTQDLDMSDEEFNASIAEVDKLLSSIEDKLPQVKVVLEGNGKLPTKPYATDSCYDLYTPINVTLYPLKTATVDLNIRFKLPTGYEGAIEGRSGNAFNLNIWVFRGIIDENYIGTIKVQLFNLGGSPITFNQGDRIAQILIRKKTPVELEVVTSLEDTDRGEKGLGASGS